MKQRCHRIFFGTTIQAAGREFSCVSLRHFKLNFQCGNLTLMLVHHSGRATQFRVLCLVREDLEPYDLQGEISDSILVQIRAPKETSMREHHLGFHARVVVVLSIDFAENLEGQVTGAMGWGYTPNAKLVLHLSRES